MRGRTGRLPAGTRGRLLPCKLSSRAKTGIQSVVHPGFRNNVSGEWEGRLVTYDPKGNALELPHHFVPEAYREWDMVPTSWQTQCSMRMMEDHVQWVNRKLIPTVGCEADSVAFEEDGRKDKTSPVPVHCLENGSFCIAPRHISVDDTWEVHHCLVKLPKEERVRMIQRFRTTSDGMIVLLDLEVIMERFDEEYNGRPLLNGCGGPCVGEFGDRPAAREDLFKMRWVSDKDHSTQFGKCRNDTGSSEAFGDDGRTDSFDGHHGTLLLPSSMWMSTSGTLDSFFYLEAGWFLDEDKVRVLSSLSFSEGRLTGGFLGMQSVCR